VNSSDNAQPTICVSGQVIVFVSRRTGSYRLWRMDADGGNPQPLIADGNDSEFLPHCAPDGNLVVYQKGWRNSSVWKVPVTGGKVLPVVATDSLAVLPKKSMRPAVSPDGKFVAYYYMDEDVWGLGRYLNRGRGNRYLSSRFHLQLFRVSSAGLMMARRSHTLIPATAFQISGFNL
jgi:Tol biopolymer transport system component